MELKTYGTNGITLRISGNDVYCQMLWLNADEMWHLYNSREEIAKDIADGQWNMPVQVLEVIIDPVGNEVSDISENLSEIVAHMSGGIEKGDQWSRGAQNFYELYNPCLPWGGDNESREYGDVA